MGTRPGRAARAAERAVPGDRRAIARWQAAEPAHRAGASRVDRHRHAGRIPALVGIPGADVSYLDQPLAVDLHEVVDGVPRGCDADLSAASDGAEHRLPVRVVPRAILRGELDVLVHVHV